MAAAIAFFGAMALAVTEPTPEGLLRPDVVTIESLKTMGEIEMPVVDFFHDKHTEALAKQNKSCETCHPVMKSPTTGLDLRSPKFKRAQDPGFQELTDLYHDGCLGCHKEMKAAVTDSGPVTCRECHTPRPRAESSRKPFGFDRSLHYRHAKAAEEKCETCHHAYNETEKKLFYDKGQEGSCRHCHAPETAVDPKHLSMKEASHLACIGCHQTNKAQNIPDKKVGPVNCGGCHDPLAQAVVQKVEDIPRMKRNQPDASIISVDTPDLKGRMTSVPFNHKFHEENNDTCRVCHHAAMDSCVKCHTLTGSKESRGVQLEQAMHLAQSDRSCLGCHGLKQTAKPCAGCHEFIAKGRNNPSQAACVSCHLPTEELLPPGLTQPEEGVLAMRLLEARPTLAGTFNVEDVPEKVVINTIIDQYEAVELPHRKIVDALVKGLKDDSLGQYFHNGGGALCQGCHHNSPPSKKPPRCASCHGRPFDADNPTKPGLKGAYHIQCLGCHKAMGLEKPVATACTECHKEKKQ